MDEEQLARDMKLRRAIDDEERIATLRQYGVLDTPPEQEYDQVIELLHSNCHMHGAAITLVDANRQWFKSHPGLDLTETPRSDSLCSVAMHQDHPLIVDDTHRDSRFVHNSLVTEDPHLRFYAGAPLVSSEGFPLGAVCLLDLQPRTLFPSQLELLSRVRDWVQATLELRRLNRTVGAGNPAHPTSLSQIQKWRTFAQYRIDEARALMIRHAAKHNFSRLKPLPLPSFSQPSKGSNSTTVPTTSISLADMAKAGTQTNAAP